MTQAELADRLGCEQSFISQIERASDPMIPRNREFIMRLFRLTWGAVTPNDWYDFPELEQLALPMVEAPPPAPAPLFDAALDQAQGERIAA